MKKKYLGNSHLTKTHKVKTSTLKTTKCKKIMKLKSQSKYLQTLQQKTLEQEINIIIKFKYLEVIQSAPTFIFFEKILTATCCKHIYGSETK